MKSNILLLRPLTPKSSLLGEAVQELIPIDLLHLMFTESSDKMPIIGGLLETIMNPLTTVLSFNVQSILHKMHMEAAVSVQTKGETQVDKKKDKMFADEDLASGVVVSHEHTPPALVLAHEISHKESSRKSSKAICEGTKYSTACRCRVKEGGKTSWLAYEGPRLNW